MELWDIYNEKREKTGRTIIRGEKLKENEYHLVVHVWIINSNGEFLIQKRAACVKLKPNMWAMTGGSAVTGDDSYSACVRELYEETGIEADMDKASVAFTVIREDNFCDVWVIKQDFDINKCRMQVEEVSDLKWASIKEIREMIKEGIFINYHYLEELFKLAEDKSGAFKIDP